MRTGLALILALAFATLVQECGGGTRPGNNSNTTPVSNSSNASSTPEANINMNIDTNSNTKRASSNENERPSPSPSTAKTDEKAKGNASSNTPPANQRKIPFYGALRHDAPPARIPAHKPEPKSSPR